MSRREKEKKTQKNIENNEAKEKTAYKTKTPTLTIQKKAGAAGAGAKSLSLFRPFIQAVVFKQSKDQPDQFSGS